MSGEETSGASRANNVLRLSMLDHLGGFLETFASRTDAEREDDAETEGEIQDADEAEAGREREHEVVLPRWTANSLDVGSWLAWELVGLQLLSGDRLPDLRMFTTAARWVLLIAAIERFDGNITRMAEALGTSRRALRGQLKAAGLYVDRTPSGDVLGEQEPLRTREPSTEVEGERVKDLW